MDDLLHTRGPLLLPAPVKTQPQIDRSVRRRRVSSSPPADKKRRQAKFEVKKTRKTEEVEVPGELHGGVQERMATSA